MIDDDVQPLHAPCPICGADLNQPCDRTYARASLAHGYHDSRWQRAIAVRGQITVRTEETS